VEVVVRRTLIGLLLSCAVVAPATTALAQRVAPAPAGDDDEEEEEEEDDILAPVRTGGDKPPTAVPVKERSLKVGVLPFVALGDVGKPVLDQAQAEVTKALNESGTVDFKALALAAQASAPAIDPAVAEGAKAGAEASLKAAQGLLAKLQFGKAKKQYEKTLTLLEKAAPALPGPEPLIEAWLGLAEIAARQAQDDEARRCLAYVVGFQPELELDQKRFPGLFVTAHRKTRDGMLAGEKSNILVDATAAGAQVTIDGRAIAAAPAKAKGLYPGAHLVRVLREGLPPWGAIITVAPGAEQSVSPGFYDPKGSGPTSDLTQNRFSPASAVTVGEAAAAAASKGGVVGVVAKQQNKLKIQLVYVDAASKKVAVLPAINTQVDLLDVGIEALKARGRVEELAAAEAPAFADADENEALIEGANAGAGVQLAEVQQRFDVKVSGNAPIASRVDDGDDGDGDGERTVVESKTGSRRRFDDKSDRTRDRGADVVDEDEPLTSQGWFLPVVIGGSVVGVAALAGATTVGLIAFKVIPDPRPAQGAQVIVNLPSASP
jgi:hypothetical protein